jgi:hypothetical protein
MNSPSKHFLMIRHIHPARRSGGSGSSLRAGAKIERVERIISKDAGLHA